MAARNSPGSTCGGFTGSFSRCRSARDAIDFRIRQQAELTGEAGGHRHAGRHRLPMQPFAVAGAELDRVAEGMTEVEQRTPAPLALVARDDPGLQLTGPADRGVQRRGIPLHQRVGVLLDPGEELRVGDQAVLHHFGEPRRQLAVGQGLQRVGIRDHAQRLVEGAHEVLATRVIDARLAADGRIHLGEQGRRHLDEIDAALIDRRGEAGDVADDAAAKRHHDAVPAEAVIHQRVENDLGGDDVLVRLAIGQHDRLDPPLRDHAAAAGRGTGGRR